MRRVARPLLYLGTLGIVLGLGRFHAQFVGHYYFHSGQRLPWSIAYAGVLCLAAYGMGLPDVHSRRGASGPALTAAVIGAGGISVVQLILGSVFLPRFVVFLGAGLVGPWFVLCDAIAGAGINRDQDRARVVAVITPSEADSLTEDLEKVPEQAASLVGALTPAEAWPAGPRAAPLIDLVGASDANLIVLDRLAQSDEAIVAQAALLHERGVRVRTLSLFYEEWLGKLPLAELERISLMFDIGEVHRLRYGRAKRLADVVLGGLGSLLLIPVVVMVAVGNLISNRGSLFYLQQRVGRNGKVFSMLKFRTMRPHADGGDWTAVDDPRITPFGRWLRRTHLDEFPQVLNVLRGELSIVGPRPEQPRYVAELREKVPFYELRLWVRPGLTGWAQVKYPYGSSETDALEKLQYDFYYLRHQSLSLDLRIMGRTIRSVVGLGGR